MGRQVKFEKPLSKITFGRAGELGVDLGATLTAFCKMFEVSGKCLSCDFNVIISLHYLWIDNNKCQISVIFRFENRSRSGWLLVVIRICAWIIVFHFLRHWGIGDFLTFVSISRFSQFSYNQQPISTKLGEMNDADECIYNFGTDIRRTSGSRLIRIRIRITFVSNFGVGGGLHSLLQTEHL